MAASKYATAPPLTTQMPGGIPYIVGNEAAERFSFYGMRAILFVFLTTHLLDAHGNAAVMTDEQAKGYVHLFVASAYFFPIIGAVVSDALLGKYRTIISLSIVYCLGHFALAFDDLFYWLKPLVEGNVLGQVLALYETRVGLAVGLFLIAVGSGGIKPCVSAHVGDQFGRRNQHLLSKVFGWFYFSINLGAFASTLLTPLLLKHLGPGFAFGLPGVLMLIATWVFWLGRRKFVHVPAGGFGAVKEAFSGDGMRAIRNLVPIYLFVAVFWSLFDQTGSAWVQQAENMDRHWEIVQWLPAQLGASRWLPDPLQSVDLLPSQIQAVNPILILILIPLFSYVIYPAINRVFPLTPLRKVSIGFFVTVIAFSVSAWIEMRITVGLRPTIAWQFLAYAVLTAAEVLVSITCLEFSYTQAPRKMKSFIMALYLLSVSLGNAFTSAVNFFIQNEDGTSKLEGADYYWFFTAVMLVASLGFIVVAKTYRGQTYIQGDDQDDATSGTAVEETSA